MSLRGQLDPTFDWLDRAYQQKTRGLFILRATG
jgi:hypothetical protein